MVNKLVLSLIGVVTLLLLVACNEANALTVKAVIAQDESGQRVIRITEVESLRPLLQAANIDVADDLEASSNIELALASGETLLVPYPAEMKTLFEEMTLVQLISDDYEGWAVTRCAGVGLRNIEPDPDSPRILIPNAGDLSAGGSNVAIRLASDGSISFISRVAGQRIRVPIDLGTKRAGQEVPSLTFEEGLRLMAAGQLTWTAKEQGPLKNGHGLPGHIASCDPRYTGQDVQVSEPRLFEIPVKANVETAASVETAPPPERDQSAAVRVVPNLDAARLDIPEMRTLLGEMTLVQLISDDQAGWAITRCAGVGLRNIEPAPDGPRILIPNAGDLSVAGSNVSIKLASDGTISFIPRVYGQRIRVPIDLGTKRTGEEVLSLTFEEGQQLLAAGQLTWTVREQGPFKNGHGLPGHIATCDPRYPGSDQD